LNLNTWFVALPGLFLCFYLQSYAQSLPAAMVEAALASKLEPAPEKQIKEGGRAPMPESDARTVDSQQAMLLLTRPVRNHVPIVPVVAALPSWKRPMVFPGAEVAREVQKTIAATDEESGFHWAGAIKQSLLFLGVQHGFAMTQEKTRRELRGPFFKDYFRSVKNLGGWEDGGRFFTNYISHPMEGSVAGFIQIQNDPKGIQQEFGKSRGYWKSRVKAMLWNAAYSTQFELGPISQSSIGNVGLHSSLDGKKRKMAYVDLVVTPTLGTAWLIGEDFLDRYVVQRWEGHHSGFRRNTLRMLLNPMRGTANLLRFKLPWHRDR
jgi:hypothetical protein